MERLEIGDGEHDGGIFAGAADLLDFPEPLDRYRSDVAEFAPIWSTPTV